MTFTGPLLLTYFCKLGLTSSWFHNLLKAFLAGEQIHKVGEGETFHLESVVPWAWVQSFSSGSYYTKMFQQQPQIVPHTAASGAPGCLEGRGTRGLAKPRGWRSVLIWRLLIFPQTSRNIRPRFSCLFINARVEASPRLLFAFLLHPMSVSPGDSL